jgi:hypothetical protein
MSGNASRARIPMTKREAPESIQSQVRADLVERERLGVERYGTALYPHNGRDALRDAYEEALDMCQYLKQALVEKGAATAPLRTRQEVDAEIASLCRECIADEWQDLSIDKWDTVTRLCTEPTEPTEPEKARSRRECGDCGLLYEGSECPAHEPEACSCEESEALKCQLRLVRAQAQQGLTSSTYPSCKAEAACREILLLLGEP